MAPQEYDTKIYIAAFHGHYNRVLEIVAHALAQSKMVYLDLNILSKETPSFKERADILSKVQEMFVPIAKTLSLEYDAFILDEYIRLMHQMADAIDNKDEKSLLEVVSELDKKPFICR
ncbi:hypothetical protein KC821_14665 [Proteus vulgaris]|uniref:hypothetical protein n=1 Tax=Proteus TaxID=583 RepID=UPI0025AEEAE5|nr:hypothetical protein [Proteus terrae]